MSNYKNSYKIGITCIMCALFICGLVILLNNQRSSEDTSTAETNSQSELSRPEKIFEDGEFFVESVTDGDTIKINYYGKVTPLRLIGVDAPETYNTTNTTTKCKGQKSTEYLKKLIAGKKVKIAKDSSQSEKDIYDRLLRYVYLEHEDIGELLLKNGFASEYTFSNQTYLHQTTYRNAEAEAKANSAGNWNKATCNNEDQSSKTSAGSTTINTPSVSDCKIKGNINNKGKKIYHVPGQKYYDSTKINTSSGERWFCTENEAVAAGWQKSKV
ncbi:MAG: thermonuclease family protein [Candidatus Saccharibacteria bacterium]|nr:thermonuclease family protein [Candidatus Saccharibacteria bacterium]